MEEVEEGALPLLFTRFGRLAQLCLPGDGRREGEVEQQTVLYVVAQCDERVTLLTALCRAQVSGQFDGEC